MDKKLGFALLRVSTPEQSLDSQEASLLKIAEEKKYKIPEKYIFREKKTGYDELGVDRQSIIDLRNAIALKKPDAIFILELSRLTRNGLKVYDYIKEFSLTPRIPMYFDDFKLWTLDPDTKEEIRENIFKLVGAGESVEKERQRIIARTKRGKSDAAAKGLFAGHLSDGYRVEKDALGQKRIVPDEQREPVIKRVFELYRNYSVAQIRDIFNTEGVPTALKYRLHSNLFAGYKAEYRDKTGDVKRRDELAWTSNTIEQILANEWYIGIRKYNGISHHIKPLITQEDWDFAKAKRAENTAPPAKGKNLFLLSGLIYCGHCGRKMYGHYLGLNNHYYCSSYENGRFTCNARGISKENVEGIIKKIVTTHLMVDAAMGVDTPVNSILAMDKKRRKEYQEKIKTFKSIILSNDSKIDELNRQLKQAMLDRIKAIDNEVQKPILDGIISELESKIVETKKNSADYEKEIQHLEYAIRKANSAAKMTERLKNASLEEIKEFFNIVISRVELYNVGKTTSVVRVYYNVGFYDEFIYSSQRHKGKYFPLGRIALGGDVNQIPQELHDSWWKITHDAKYIQKGMSPITNLSYHPDDKQIHFDDYQTLCFDDNHGFFIISDALERIKKECKEKNVSWTFQEINSPISVDFYLQIFGSDSKTAWDYEKIEGLSERGKELLNYAKQYRKKYNTGKPTCEPYITKDEMYAAVQTERKRLYNRIYKINNNKSLTDADKKIMIGDIRKRLKELKYKINYFGDSIRATKYKVVNTEDN